VSDKAAAPARIRTLRISSEAYALEEIASELRMASAFFLGRRSSISCSLASGFPMKMRRTPA
jgi:hypothetical protein